MPATVNQPVFAPTVLSILVVVMFGGTLAILLIRPIPLDANQTTLLSIMLGALVRDFGNSVNYWLGSSAGSKAKDEALASSLRQNERPSQ